MPRRNSPNKQNPRQLPYPALHQCQLKCRFPTEKQAQRAADDQMLTDFHLHLGVYQCGICKGWHLTSREQ